MCWLSAWLPFCAKRLEVVAAPRERCFLLRPKNAAYTYASQQQQQQQQQKRPRCCTLKATVPLTAPTTHHQGDGNPEVEGPMGRPSADKPLELRRATLLEGMVGVIGGDANTVTESSLLDREQQQQQKRQYSAFCSWILHVLALAFPRSLAFSHTTKVCTLSSSHAGHAEREKKRFIF
jgi:hypothetical protein